MPLSTYKDKVLLIVNTATSHGFTPQYEGPEKTGAAWIFYPDKMEVTNKTTDYDALVKILQGRPRPNPARHHIPRRMAGLSRPRAGNPPKTKKDPSRKRGPCVQP